MNPTEIFEALDALGKAPYDPNELPFCFAEAADNAKATIAKLRGATNKSDIEGGVLLNGKFHFAPALPGMADAVLDEIKGSNAPPGPSQRSCSLPTASSSPPSRERPGSALTSHSRSSATTSPSSCQNVDPADPIVNPSIRHSSLPVIQVSRSGIERRNGVVGERLNSSAK